MPIRTKDYIHTQLHPIFEMHLPEGYLLAIIKKHFSKLRKTDDFGLLQLMSYSIRGRVSYVQSISKLPDEITLANLLHSKDDNLFGELVDRFALTSVISGVQPKIKRSTILIESA
jgi:serine/threonine-protein kinase HipA